MAEAIDGGETAGASSPGTAATPDAGAVEVLRTPSPDMRTSWLAVACVLGPQAASLAFDPTQWGRWIIVAGVLLALLVASRWAADRTRNPVRVELTRDGLSVVRPRRRAEEIRSHPWREIDTLRVDPRGGSRTIRLQMRDGRYLSPASLVEDDVPRLIARWEVERRRHSS